MLNQRQKNIVRDLESSRIPVPAKSLAQKYHVSIRTIRNDTAVIADFAKAQGLNFLHVPGTGLRIIPDGPVSRNTDALLRMDEFAVSDAQRRQAMVAMCFLYLQNPLTYEGLSERFGVSRGTVIEAVRQTEASMGQNLSIQGVRNKGLFLKGSVSDKVRLAEKTAAAIGEENYYHSLVLAENDLTGRHFCDMQTILDFTEHHLYLFVSDAYRLTLLVNVVLNQAQNQQHYEHADSMEKLDQFAAFLEYQFHRHIGAEEKRVLKYILSATTDYALSLSHQSDQSIEDNVQLVIDDVAENRRYRISDPEILKSDLVIHLKASIEAQQSGFPRNNPLLAKICASYPDEFQTVKAACLKYQNCFPVTFTDDEVGFITLYFLRSFEKVSSIRQSRIMVVCNTGRSAAKLLAARLMNNIPDIHITTMGSAVDISRNPDAVSNVDFIISTIPLRNVSKPYIVVSPLLDESEIEKVRQALWISKRADTEDFQSIDQLSGDMAGQTIRSRSINTAIEKNTAVPDAKNVMPLESAQLLGEVMLDTCVMISKLYPDGIPNDQYGNVSGIIAHVIMSVPRWQQGDLIRTDDDMALLAKHPKQQKIILDFLDQISKKLNVFINPAEAVAILRYCLF